MGARRIVTTATVFATSLLLIGPALFAERVPQRPPPFPSTDQSRWIGPSVDWPALRGRVVLVKVWTFG